MAKIAPKKTITKKTFDLDKFKKDRGYDNVVATKPLSWIPFSDAFHKAVKLPGVARGYQSTLRGYSNTGKSTGIYEAVAGCHKIGDLPVIIITEGVWSWEHAKNIGANIEPIYNEDKTKIIDWKGDFMFFDGSDLLKMYQKFDYKTGKEGTKKLRNEPVIEDVARLITELLDAQDEGGLDRDLCFLWDSVGSINGYQSVISTSSNNQWNAGAMESAFKALVNHRIPASLKMTSKYTNTFVCVQKIWLDNENKVIKHKGGEAFFYSPRLIFHFGNILTHGAVSLHAIAGGNIYQFGIKTKVKCVKNHINGIEEVGEIASTAHGYWDASKAGIEQYKKEHKDFILDKLKTNLDDFEIKEVQEEFNSDDLYEDEDVGGNTE